VFYLVLGRQDRRVGNGLTAGKYFFKGIGASGTGEVYREKKTGL